MFNSWLTLRPGRVYLVQRVDGFDPVVVASEADPVRRVFRHALVVDHAVDLKSLKILRILADAELDQLYPGYYQTGYLV